MLLTDGSFFLILTEICKFMFNLKKNETLVIENLIGFYEVNLIGKDNNFVFSICATNYCLKFKCNK